MLGNIAIKGALGPAAAQKLWVFPPKHIWMYTTTECPNIIIYSPSVPSFTLLEPQGGRNVRPAYVNCVGNRYNLI
jgi:hypothetical protein